MLASSGMVPHIRNEQVLAPGTRKGPGMSLLAFINKKPPEKSLLKFLPARLHPLTRPISWRVTPSSLVHTPYGDCFGHSL